MIISMAKYKNEITTTQDRKHMFEESCSKNDEDKCCKILGITIMVVGLALIIFMVYCWTTVPDWYMYWYMPIGMMAGFLLYVLGFMIHGYYQSEIKARKRQQHKAQQQEQQEEDRKTSVLATTSITSSAIQMSWIGECF